MSTETPAAELDVASGRKSSGQPMLPEAPLRVLLVIDSLAPGGAQRQLVNLGVELARRGHHVECFTYHGLDFFAPLLAAAGVRWHLARKAARYSLQPVLALRKLLRESSFDAIISFLAVPSLYAIAATAGLSHRPALVVSQRTSPFGSGYTWHDRLALRLFRLADHVTVNSHHMREFLAQRYPRLASKLTTIWNGVDLQHFRPAPRPAPASELQLLAIGNLAPGKSWFTLARSLRILRDQHGVQAKVTWVGSLEHLPREYEQERSRIVSFLSEHQLNDQWHWLGRQDDVAPLLASHDALVHPSTQEGLPNVVCEALACGCPTIVSDALDHPRLVHSGISGFLFRPNDAGDLAASLAKLQRLDAAQRESMSHAARRFAEENLALATCGDRYESLLHAVTASRKEPS